MNNTEKPMASSSGHKLGQIVGDWFEEYVALDLLERVAKALGLYLDHRFKKRHCRNEKILWHDNEGNAVDYDFVLELFGSDHDKGIPVAFFETFWRRGARHSKDKARDDSGKLLPMRMTYPTVRILGILSAGDFTKPAQELVKSRSIDLFYIPKEQICQAWRSQGIEIDYPDNAVEEQKQQFVRHAINTITQNPTIKQSITQQLITSMGEVILQSYVQRIIAHVSSIPIAYRITHIYRGHTLEFFDHNRAARYMKEHSIEKEKLSELTHQVGYEAIYNDGEIFERDKLLLTEALELHAMVGKVADYFKHYHVKKNNDQ